MKKIAMEQVRHFFRLMESGLATRQNFQQYLEGLSHPAEDDKEEKKGVATPKSEWQEMYSRQRVWDSDFSETHFPLESETELRPVDHVHEFPELVIGVEALRRLDAEGLELARPRATGLYLLEHPELQKERPLVGGGQWQSRTGSVRVPIFHWNDDEPFVGLHWLVLSFRSHYGWLVSRKSGV